MVLSDEESGVDGEDLTVRVERYAVAGLHVPVLGKVSDKIVLNPPHGYECGRVVRHLGLQVNGALEYTAVLSDIVLRIRNYSDPLTAI